MSYRDGARHTGVAVLTASVERQRVLRQQLAAAGIAHWIVLLQDTRRGRILPPFGGPFLLDTTGVERSLLATLLAELHVRRIPPPTLALVAPDDVAAQRLSLLCSAVYAVAATTIPMADLRQWLRYVGVVGPQRHPAVQPACLGVAPTALPMRDGDLLPILAELPHAQTIQQAAAACAMSERTLKRKLTTIRLALGVAATGLTRSRPHELAARLWTALGTDGGASPARSADDGAWTSRPRHDRADGEVFAQGARCPRSGR